MATDWPAIHTERAALIQDLTGLDAAAWATPSLCAGWSVHDVLAHQTATARLTPLSFLRNLVAARFDFDRYFERLKAAESGGGPEATLATYRSLAGRTTSPPGPGAAWLGEVVVHAEDIRRPLGLRREYDRDVLLSLIRFYAGSNALIGGKRRVDGVTLVATDADLRLGSGPEVHGPALALLLATTGRSVALAELDGPGVEILRTR